MYISNSVFTTVFWKTFIRHTHMLLKIVYIIILIKSTLCPAVKTKRPHAKY